jgi:glycine cleavage system H protein
MSKSSLRYTNTHEWARIEGSVAVVGITDYAQHALGDITYVELPAVGRKVTKGQPCGVIESVKAASDLFAPLSGEVIEINTALEQAPEKVNQSPHDEGWMYKLTGFDPREFESLMDGDAYDRFVAAIPAE